VVLVGANEIHLQLIGQKNHLYGLGDRGQTKACREKLRELFPRYTPRKASTSYPRCTDRHAEPSAADRAGGEGSSRVRLELSHVKLVVTRSAQSSPAVPASAPPAASESSTDR